VDTSTGPFASAALNNNNNDLRAAVFSPYWHKRTIRASFRHLTTTPDMVTISSCNYFLVFVVIIIIIIIIVSGWHTSWATRRQDCEIVRVHSAVG